MFRLSQLLRQLLHEQPTGREQSRAAGRWQGPVVVWNLLRRCNLSCRHCYSVSADRDFQGELSTEEIFRVLDDLHAFGVPAIILSGGEPLLHPDLFVIAKRAKALGFYLGLSSNGTLMDAEQAARIQAVGFDYVGVSLDGLEAHHDRNRMQEGAFQQALAGIRACRQNGVKAGIRFTPTKENSQDLPGLFALMDAEGIDRFYLSHWNYAGRGKGNRGDDAARRTTRQLVEWLFAQAYSDWQQGSNREIVTGNNDSDGPFFLMWVQRHLPEQAERANTLLQRWGGNASGVGIANIDNRGLVHPDIFWWDHILGSVREQSFATIWNNPQEPLLLGLRQKPRPVQGRCGQCRYLSICGGNTRVRAWQLTGNPWAEDPGCYLQDDEILL
ncbi:MAG: heme d1 biosynthesis radical SAM protein NirJ [Magnetococcales bacterium]|nr:heme d1 biosynthesis radical SAM protein NirJ [Magnetococcales bacterium]